MELLRALVVREFCLIHTRMKLKFDTQLSAVDGMFQKLVTWHAGRAWERWSKPSCLLKVYLSQLNENATPQVESNHKLFSGQSLSDTLIEDKLPISSCSIQWSTVQLFMHVIVTFETRIGFGSLSFCTVCLVLNSSFFPFTFAETSSEWKLKVCACLRTAADDHSHHGDRKHYRASLCGCGPGIDSGLHCLSLYAAGSHDYPLCKGHHGPLQCHPHLHLGGTAPRWLTYFQKYSCTAVPK